MIFHFHFHLAISIDFCLILWYFVAFLTDRQNILFKYSEGRSLCGWLRVGIRAEDSEIFIYLNNTYIHMYGS